MEGLESGERLCVPTNPLAERNTVAPWTFTGPGSLLVLDLGDIGDTFRSFDNSVQVGDTSAAPATGNPCGFDIACALTHTGVSGYSSGMFNILGAGSHSITISLLTNAPNTTFGQAVFSLSPTVPEPATLGLIGASLAGLALLGRHGRRG
jgi:hypothetical protein